MTQINTLTVNGTAYALADTQAREALEALKADSAIVAEAVGENITIGDGSGEALRITNLYGKTAQAGAPTPESPIPVVSAGDNDGISVFAMGKNLIPFPYTGGSRMEKNGLTFEVQEDGAIIINGTATADTAYNIGGEQTLAHLRVGETYTISGCPKGGSSTTFRLSYQGNNSSANEYGDGKTFTIVDNSTRNRIFLTVYSGYTANNLVFRPQLELGSAATAFETPLPVQSGALGGVVLRGMPFSTGNYADSSGVKWVADEIDAHRKKIIRSVGFAACDGTEKWSLYSANTFCREFENRAITRTNCLCSHFYLENVSTLVNHGSMVGGGNNTRIYFRHNGLTTVEQWKAWLAEQASAGTPLTITYGLAEPAEEALSEAGAAALEGLHTYKPHTQITSPAGVGIRVTYTADTKAYIDNKFAALQNAILASGANI